MSRNKRDILSLVDTKQSQAMGLLVSRNHPKPLEHRLGELIKRRDLLKRVRTTG